MDEKKLPLTSHLQELRKRLILSFIAVGIGSSSVMPSPIRSSTFLPHP